ncbi:hypothetical protein PUNSTDRAFT_75081, partial [Punctularia strigosozonata HHB-11173 SS5]
SQIATWIPHRNDYLDALLAHEAPGLKQNTLKCQTVVHNDDGTTRACGTPSPTIRCRDCFSCQTIECVQCCLRRHKDLPFHRIEQWNGHYFKRTSLHGLGYKLHLCRFGAKCSNSTPGPRNFVVFHTNGHHRLRLIYCGCGTPVKSEQLLLFRLFPATTAEPRTAFTFDCLNTFHLLNLQGKLTLHDYYQAMIRMTDNMEPAPGIWRYHDAILAVREWRHLKMLKRAGRGNDPSGIRGTPVGGLAVECPACPHPGRNLPDNWETDLRRSWLYTQFIGVDACFKLKLRDRGFQDPALGDGLAYFVSDVQYKHHLKECTNVQDVEPCDAHHHAVSQMNTKNNNKKVLVTGLGAVVCARHSLMRKNAVADLTKGERQVTMDYIFWSTLADSNISMVVASYDIACSWSIHLMDRLRRNYADKLVQKFSRIGFIFMVPKVHLPSHGKKCRRLYDFQHQPHVGRTHGETIEQQWAHLGGVATSTVEMAPEGRRSALEDHMGNWNHVMKINMGKNMFWSLTEALNQSVKHRQLYEDLSSTFDEGTIQRWTGLIHAFERDKKAGKDPYAEPEQSQTYDQIRKRLEDEEKATEKDSESDGSTLQHDFSPSEYVQRALKLLDRQRAMTRDIATQQAEHHCTTADLQRKREVFRSDVRSLTKVAVLFMPCLALASEDEEVLPSTSRSIVHLPSSLVAAGLPLSGCVSGIVRAEEQMRTAEAADALEALCRMRRSYMGLIHKYKVNVFGSTSANTRSRAVLKGVGRKIHLLALKYRDARLALVALNPKGSWRDFLLELRDDDIRGPYPEEDEREGRREDSWIWRSRGRLVRQVLKLDGSVDGMRLSAEEELDETMLYMWAAARARFLRWQEEVHLLVEEMRRIIAFLHWQADSWLSKRGSRHGVVISFAADCYASRQADQCRALAASFVQRWAPLLKRTGHGEPWIHEYVSSLENTSLEDRDEEAVDEELVDAEDENEDGDQDEDQDVGRKNAVLDATDYSVYLTTD